MSAQRASYSLNSLNGVIQESIMGVIKGHTRSLDHSSYGHLMIICLPTMQGVPGTIPQIISLTQILQSLLRERPMPAIVNSQSSTQNVES